MYICNSFKSIHASLPGIDWSYPISLLYIFSAIVRNVVSVPFDLSSAFCSMDLIVFYCSHLDLISKLKIYLEMWYASAPFFTLEFDT